MIEDPELLLQPWALRLESGSMSQPGLEWALVPATPTAWEPGSEMEWEPAFGVGIGKKAR
jgi:hypothetical protein